VGTAVRHLMFSDADAAATGGAVTRAPKYWLIVVLAVAVMSSAHADNSLVVVSAKEHLVGNRWFQPAQEAIRRSGSPAAPPERVIVGTATP
jgi:hypothetical protein